MMRIFLSFVLVLAVKCNVYDYQPTWDSLDKRPLPAWFDKAKIGIFLHWGVFAVPAFGSEWFWANWQLSKAKSYVDFMEKNYRPNFSYQEFAHEFRAEFYEPEKWATLFQASGAKYVVLTSKHHEGFTLWPSHVSWNWNAMDIGPRRDVLGELAAAIRNKTDLKFGVYHSLFEWFNPLYLLDKANQYKTRYFVEVKTMPELIELVLTYHPEVIWSDGDWEAPDTYWKSTEFLAWLYNKSPVKDTVVVNDRWGKDIPCKHGGYYTCSDRYNPKKLQKHKWENAMTVDKGSWGYRKNVDLSDMLSIEELITTMAETVSCGGNLLVNVGPTSDGRIVPVFEERLRQMGSWLKINGEAIYESTPWTYQNDTIAPDVWYTKKEEGGKSSVYAIVLKWPKNNKLILGALQLSDGAQLNMLGVAQPVSWTRSPDKTTVVDFGSIPTNLIPSNWAWVLKTSEENSVA